MKQTSLAQQIQRLILIPVVIVAFLTLGFDSFYRIQTLFETTEETTELIHSLMLNSAEEAIALGNYDYFLTAAQNLVNREEIDSIELLDIDRRPLAHAPANIDYSLGATMVPVYRTTMFTDTSVGDDLFGFEERTSTPERKLVGYLMIRTSHEALFSKLLVVVFQLLIIVLIVIIVLVVARRRIKASVEKPFVSLTDGINALFDGNYSHIVPVEAAHEFRDLATKLNFLATTLQSRDAEVKLKHAQLVEAQNEAHEAHLAKIRFIKGTILDLQLPLRTSSDLLTRVMTDPGSKVLRSELGIVLANVDKSAQLLDSLESLSELSLTPLSAKPRLIESKYLVELVEASCQPGDHDATQLPSTVRVVSNTDEGFIFVDDARLSHLLRLITTASEKEHQVAPSVIANISCSDATCSMSVYVVPGVKLHAKLENVAGAASLQDMMKSLNVFARAMGITLSLQSDSAGGSIISCHFDMPYTIEKESFIPPAITGQLRKRCCLVGYIPESSLETEALHAASNRIDQVCWQTVQESVDVLQDAEVVIIDCSHRLEAAKQVVIDYRTTYKGKAKLIAIITQIQARAQIAMDLFDLGFDDYIVRPFSISDLSAKIRTEAPQFSVKDVFAKS